MNISRNISSNISSAVVPVMFVRGEQFSVSLTVLVIDDKIVVTVLVRFEAIRAGWQ